MLTRLYRYPTALWSKYVFYRFSLRSFASTSNVPDTEVKPTQIEKKFGKVESIYEFAYMPYASWITNLKIYLLPFLVATAIFVDQANQIGYDYDDYEKMIILLSELNIWIHTAVLSIPVKNLVGHIYTNPKSDIIVSYLDYWGNRRDEKFTPGDLFLESRETGLFKFFRRNTWYLFLISRSSGRKFRINIKNSDVYDEDTFVRLLGEIPPTKYNYL